MRFRKAILLFFVAVIVLMPRPASASPENAPLIDDRVVAGGTFTLGEGESLNGSLFVLAGTVDLEKGSTVTGDVVVVGGTVVMAGEVEGSLVALGGVVSLKESLVIRGDMFAPGSVVSREEGATIEGQVVVDLPSINFTLPESPAPSQQAPQTAPTFFDAIRATLSPVIEGLWFLFKTAIVAGMAVLLSVFLPQHTEQVRKSLTTQPVISGALGLLAIFLTIPISLVLLITLFLSPLALLLMLGVMLATLFGMAALGLEVGRRLAEAFHQEWTTAAQMGIGVFLTAFLTGSIRFVFWDIFWLMAVLALSALGLGAVILSRLGTRNPFEFEPAAGPDAASEIES